MMTFSLMARYVGAEPFRPFVIHTASGRKFQVRHPEMVSLGRTAITVYVEPDDAPEKPPQRQEVSLMLIESVEVPAPSGRESKPESSK